MRKLAPDESALWAKVAATIRPLSRNAADRDPIPATIAPRAAIRMPDRPNAPATAVARPIGQTLDGGWDRRLARGHAAPDRVIDLHGHSLDSAWQEIDEGLANARARGERLVLLITGHERKGDPPLERGRIRAVVKDWLAVSRHASAIGAIRNAHPRHGGGGSLYLVLRRC